MSTAPARATDCDETRRDAMEDDDLRRRLTLRGVYLRRCINGLLDAQRARGGRLTDMELTLLWRSSAQLDLLEEFIGTVTAEVVAEVVASTYAPATGG